MAATVRLAGSARPRARASEVLASRPLTGPELQAPAAVTLHLREAPAHDSLAVVLARQHHTPAQSGGYPTAAVFGAAHHAHVDDVAAVGRWAAGAGLRVRARTASQTALDLIGPLGSLAGAFDVDLVACRAHDPRTGALTAYRDHRDELSVPERLEGVVTAALGLSDQPLARPRLAVLPRGTIAAHTYTAEEVAGIYDFPVLAQGGEGMTITVGIAELGGAVHRPDLAAFRVRNPRVRVIRGGRAGMGPGVRPVRPRH